MLSPRWRRGPVPRLRALLSVGPRRLAVAVPNNVIGPMLKLFVDKVVPELLLLDYVAEPAPGC